MTSCYGSTKVPERLFGEDTEELLTFREACYDVAPGVFTLLGELLATWRPYAMSHEWVLPDNYHVKCRVMETITAEGVQIDELDKASFTYQYKENVGLREGLSNAANIVHSVDAFVLRELVRRCNYDRDLVEEAHRLITAELLRRPGPFASINLMDVSKELQTYVRRYLATGMVSVVILPYLSEHGIQGMPYNLLRSLNKMICSMLEYRPFPVITIHDSFSAHPNNVNWVRHWYKELMAELSESTILDDIFTQLYGTSVTYNKRNYNLAPMIRQSNYALC